MIKPPTLPVSYADSPVTPHEAKQASNSVRENGRRLQLALNGLIIYNALSVLLGVVTPLLLLKYMPEFIRAVDPTASTADFEEARRAIPTWIAPLMSLLYTLMPAVNIWCLNALRQATRALQGWTLTPTQDGGQEVKRRLLQVRPWVTLGQWLPIIFSGFILLFIPRLQ